MSSQKTFIAWKGRLYHNGVMVEIDPERMTVAARIIAIMRAREETTTEFAERIGISPQLLNAWLKSGNEPSKPNARRITNATDVTWEWIFFGKRSGLPGNLVAKVSPDLLRRAAEEAELRQRGHWERRGSRTA